MIERSEQHTMHNHGQTRSAKRHDHLLQTPDTFVRTPLPNLTGGTAVIHIGSAAGAAFAEYTVEFEAGGTWSGAGLQRFLYVLEGELELTISGGKQLLTAAGYAYLPAALSCRLAAQTAARAVIIERRPAPESSADMPAPEFIVGREEDCTAVPLAGDVDLQVRNLLPDNLAYDFAVNTMTYQPGAALSMVEVHVMEHGLLMLEGGGIYRLGDSWYSVTAGDFIWMGPFCPQWFGAIGKVAAKYLIYKDWVRHPMERR